MERGGEGTVEEEMGTSHYIQDLESQIDYFMLRQSEVMKVKKCKVVPGEDCPTQHRLLCCDLVINNMKTPKMQKREKRIKLWKLKN